MLGRSEVSVNTEHRKSIEVSGRGLTALVAAISVVLSGLELGGDLNQLLIAIVAGVLLPLWAILLAMRIGQANRMESGGVAEDEPVT